MLLRLLMLMLMMLLGLLRRLVHTLLRLLLLPLMPLLLMQQLLLLPALLTSRVLWELLAALPRSCRLLQRVARRRCDGKTMQLATSPQCRGFSIAVGYRHLRRS